MKKVDIGVRICAILLVVLFFVPFISIIFDQSYGGYSYDHKESGVSLLQYTFGIGKVWEKPFPDGYGFKFLPLLLIATAAAIAIAGAKKYLISGIAAVVHIIVNVVVYFASQSDLLKAAAGITNTGDELEQALAKYELESIRDDTFFSVGAGMVLQIIICIAIILICVELHFGIVKKHLPALLNKKIPSVTPKKDGGAATTARCPVCESAITDGDAFCGVCGADLANKSTYERAPENDIPICDTAPTSTASIICPDCGAEVNKDDIFCGNCGYSFANKEITPNPEPEKEEKIPAAPEAPFEKAPKHTSADLTCPGCGAKITKDDIFCGGCGYSLVSKEVKPMPTEPTPAPGVPTKETETATTPTKIPTVAEKKPTSGLKSTMRTKPSSESTPTQKNDSGKGFFNKPSDL